MEWPQQKMAQTAIPADHSFARRIFTFHGQRWNNSHRFDASVVFCRIGFMVIFGFHTASYANINGMTPKGAACDGADV
jgi:hypothetical protein